MIPFLSLSAETAAVKAFSAELVDEEEEASLTSLDEELSLLDEEFEEFKEELYSLENELKSKENSSLPVIETFLKTEPSQEQFQVLDKEKNNAQDEVVEYRALSPEIEPVHDQTAVETTPSLIEKKAGSDQVSAKHSKDELDKKSVQKEAEEGTSLHVEFLPAVEITESLKEPATENSIAPVVEKSNARDSAQYSTGNDKASSVLETQKMLSEDRPANLSVQGASVFGEHENLKDEAIVVDLKQAFEGSPIIYSLLFAMSVLAVGVWLYSILSLRSSASVSQTFVKNLKNKLNSNNFDEALSLCQETDNLFSKMLSSGINSRRHGLPVMIEAMKAEGKRASIAFWQKIGLLNDIAIIAPMLGLLGTVLGMFYAFYDVNRSIESVSTLFDGLGISVGTTVAGLVVAIIALFLHSTAKYRLVRALALVENEAQGLATLIDDRTSIYKGS